MRTAMVVGNGFTKSLTSHLDLSLNTSNPLAWPVLSPGKASRLLDDLPHLRKFIEQHEGCSDDFALFRYMLEGSIATANSPLPPTETEAAVLDAGHYLALAFSYFQLALDSEDLSQWAWFRWLRQRGQSLRAVLSWNYDLVAELALARIGRPYNYAGVNTPCECGDFNYALPAVTVCKPHGSCNFGSVINLQVLDDNNGAPVAAGYPRQVHATAFDAPLRILRREDLPSVRPVADLVLPGEVNRFHRHLFWVSNALARFAYELTSVDHLVIVGFSMMDCDRDEFVAALGNRSDFPRVTVVDPSPNPLLLKLMEERSTSKVEVITDGLPT